MAKTNQKTHLRNINIMHLQSSHHWFSKSILAAMESGTPVHHTSDGKYTSDDCTDLDKEIGKAFPLLRKGDGDGAKVVQEVHGWEHSFVLPDVVEILVHTVLVCLDEAAWLAGAQTLSHPCVDRTRSGSGQGSPRRLPFLPPQSK